MSAPNELSFLPEDYLEQKYLLAMIFCARRSGRRDGPRVMVARAQQNGTRRSSRSSTR